MNDNLRKQLKSKEKTEKIWVTYFNHQGQMKYIMTSKKQSRDFYFLYEVLENGELNKLGKAKDPTELEKKYKVDEKIKN